MGIRIPVSSKRVNSYNSIKLIIKYYKSITIKFRFKISIMVKKIMENIKSMIGDYIG